MGRYLRFVYSGWSHIYDTWVNRIFAFDRKAVMKALQPKRGERILEIGVGTGLNIPYYPSRVSIVGIDFSKAMLAKAKSKPAKAAVRLRVMNATRLRFKSNHFNKALATYVLRVAPQPKAVLHEVARVTKPGSMFVILDQFREKDLLSTVSSKISEPFKLLLGWGKDYQLDELVNGTPWKIYSQKRFGRMKGTKLVILKNSKMKQS